MVDGACACAETSLGIYSRAKSEPKKGIEGKMKVKRNMDNDMCMEGSIRSESMLKASERANKDVSRAQGPKYSRD